MDNIIIEYFNNKENRGKVLFQSYFFRPTRPPVGPPTTSQISLRPPRPQPPAPPNKPGIRPPGFSTTTRRPTTTR